ncbi:hypothetical protein D4764_09G0004230 [Takifugu flavidus]|uniref:Uncharacterized protein n=1 Tax=Takifugu flavidus TaxID=433684 RepID=A0A5C6MJK3_9TELE|nr:hypothetical protein D4764_09G0004230 [Takifugu flavidus]
MIIITFSIISIISITLLLQEFGLFCPDDR